MKKSVVGIRYRTANGVIFTVLAGEEYPDKEVSKRYKDILLLEKGVLVAVPYRGINIPNITVEGGVVRLTKVSVDGRVFDRPKAISAVIGVEKAMHPYEIEEIG